MSVELRGRGRQSVGAAYGYLLLIGGKSECEARRILLIRSQGSTPGGRMRRVYFLLIFGGHIESRFGMMIAYEIRGRHPLHVITEEEL
jgi:hypothetical protein